jgi:hypothetical protein
MAAEFTERGKISVAGVCGHCPNCFLVLWPLFCKKHVYIYTIVSVRAIPVVVIELSDAVTEEGINISRDIS